MHASGTYGVSPCHQRHWKRPWIHIAYGLILTLLVSTGGCSRAFYRERADEEAYAIAREATRGTSWQVDETFTIEPAPDSRLYIGGDPDHPPLPVPYPQLYAYTLPARIVPPEFTPEEAPQGPTEPPAPTPAPLPPPGVNQAVHRAGIRRERGGGPPRVIVAQHLVPLTGPTATAQQDSAQKQPSDQAETPEEAQETARPESEPRPDQAQSMPVQLPEEGQLTAEELARQRLRREITSQLFVAPLPENAWESLPRSCLIRMLEFESARQEYERSFKAPPPRELRDPSPKLTLDQLVQLALINSREYQAQKESLYRAALAVSLARFDYQLKFGSTNQGTTLDYNHNRTGGVTVNTLRIPTNFSLEQLMLTGGDLLLRLANDIVLTFNGPQGFEADVSSQLVAQISQVVLQRDTRFEPLIQAERNLIYAARDFLRFRRRFFTDIARDYYNLLRTYRQVEIDAQNYFSLVRAFEQAVAEEQAGLQSRIQVEQIEQSMLQGRSSLISTCNRLDNELDQFKLRLGLPTEQPINLDLSELEELTRQDEIQVARERTRRAVRWLELQQAQPGVEQAAVLNASAVLAQRLYDWLELRQRRGEPVPALPEVLVLLRTLEVEQARVTVEGQRANLQQTLRAEVLAPPPELVVQRAIDLIEAEIELASRLMSLLEAQGVQQSALQQFQAELDQLLERAADIQRRFEEIIRTGQLAGLEQLQRDAVALADEFEQYTRRQLQAAGVPVDESEEERAERINGLIGSAREVARQLLEGVSEGLTPVQISMDDAMLTALFLRLDLLNERGRVADAWRDIKYAADELRSFLNLQANQTIGTKPDRPFGFTFDNSNTQVRISLDLPLNRKQQRNQYRAALIDYHAAIRRLMEQEDNIKLSVRRQLRNLALSRALYDISVASAALAAERVVNTRMQLALGLPGVQARDFLEAQDAFRRALSSVADNRIGYITGRMQFFLDLELIELDERGMWPYLKEMSHQPPSVLDWREEALPVYGKLPEFLWLSNELRQMEAAGYPPFRHAELHEPAPVDDSETMLLPPQDETNVVEQAGWLERVERAPRRRHESPRPHRQRSVR